MSAPRPLAALSALDTERWRTVTAKASDVTGETLSPVLEFCRQNTVRLLIARCAASELTGAQAMEAAGFQLMDTLVFYSRAVTDVLPDEAAALPIRTHKTGDEAGVRAVAAQAFAGYQGHYHADPRLDQRQCDELYVDWAYRSCLSREIANAVLVAESDARIAAFATLRLNSAEEGEGVLFGVAPAAQGRGIYRSLMLAGMRWCKAQGCSRMVVSTQLTNLAVQKVWSRLGFEPSSACYTFHKWF
ncbi:MAG TPA: GNAT family N-acetyltransferase [Burkholderiales bacterium]|nr:GNAT family N-acetyltransferase [Burkholderiales bacterium]